MSDQVACFTHYVLFGAEEGRNGSAYFDANRYLAEYDDVAAADVDPLAHFLQFGFSEGRLAYTTDPVMGY